MMVLFSGKALAEDYKEQRTGIEFPETIGAFKRMKITPYQSEPGKAGVAIEYRSEDTEITAYVRAAGDEVYKNSGEFLAENLAAIKELETRGQYSDVKVFDFSPGKEKSGWKTAAFTARMSNRPVVSFIYCNVVPGYLLKIRATTGNARNDLLQSFMNQLQELMSLPSKKS